MTLRWSGRHRRLAREGAMPVCAGWDGVPSVAAPHVVIRAQRAAAGTDRPSDEAQATAA